MPADEFSPIVSPPESKASGRGPSKKLILIVCAVLVAGLVGTVLAFTLRGGKDNNGGKAVAISNKVANVTIESSGYVPVTVKIKRGQQITWTNNLSQPRRLMADQEVLTGFQTDEPLNTGDTYTYTFTDAGTFHYFDPDNPKTYVGTIEVQ